MARKERIKKNKYSYEKQLKKVVKNPDKRANAGTIIFINGKDMEYPPRLVDLSGETVKAKDLEISKKFFEDSSVTINGFPTVFIKGNDIMTSVGLYYNSLIEGKGEYTPPAKLVMSGYYIKDDTTGKEVKVEGKRPLLETFQPSQTLPPSIMMGMIYSLSKTGDIKEWLKKNKMIIYIMIGVAIAAAGACLFSYQIYSDQLPKLASSVAQCAARNIQPVAEVIALS